MRTACDITGESGFYIIGSSAILHIFNDAELSYLNRSVEADLIAWSGDPAIADTLSVIMGELSPFHAKHNVYADGLTFETPTFAPPGWQQRAVKVLYKDIGVTARFMELHDLVLSKLGAGRPKDLEFCEALAKTGYLSKAELENRLPMVKCSSSQRLLLGQRILQIFS